ncbi:hypothetical protein EV644_12083 [Kribbella orskensis]|uniref:ATP/GTP-binding protein n=1 Tax=Kribbella orskensis TaxID=2512216 RepID=A0ABY2BBM3_9ACTN|nr:MULTISPECIES: hypothetical protein [Kribbella]TCN34235.1 hypothetical protein EV642_12236 [Kribbella sp. VKM Ac-2500]TCO14459.1 hypothetical protein EV644_12083 [Kribbella orskensis]
MLTLFARVLMVSAFLLALAPSPLAVAGTSEDPVLVEQCSTVTSICTYYLESVVNLDGSETKKAGAAGKRVCEFGGAAQACTSALGNWSNGQQCYLQRLEPQPLFSDPAWQGHTDGAVWACVREQGYDEGRHLVTRWVWLPGAPDTVVADPVTLAYQAIPEMQLAPPQVKSAPGVGQVGLVNMPVWLWVVRSENTWGPIEREASVPGLTVTARAQVKAINWNMGDGKTIRCEGAGTAYSKAMGVKDSPDCGHRYRKTSREQTGCKYKVTATAEWDITWQSTLGDTGQIAMTQQASTQMQIGEAIPVLVDPDGDQASQPSQSAGC